MDTGSICIRYIYIRFIMPYLKEVCVIRIYLACPSGGRRRMKYGTSRSSGVGGRECLQDSM